MPTASTTNFIISKKLSIGTTSTSSQHILYASGNTRVDGVLDVIQAGETPNSGFVYYGGNDLRLNVNRDDTIFPAGINIHNASPTGVSSISFSTGDPNGAGHLNANGTGLRFDNSTKQLRFQAGNAGYGNVGMYFTNNFSDNIQFSSVYKGLMMHLDGGNGNVGIGTTSPLSKFHVYDESTNAVIARFTAGGSSKILFDATNGAGIKIDPSQTLIFTENVQLNIEGRSAHLNIRTDNIGYAVNLQSTGGRVGVGTFTPSTTLDVIGGGKFSDNLWAAASFFVSNNVGIGTTSPSYRLDVFGGDTRIYSGSTRQLRLEGPTTTGIDLVPVNNGGYFSSIYTEVNTGLIINTLTSLGNILFNTNSTTAMFINGSNQNIGVGISSPTYKLQVNGDIKIESGYTLILVSPNGTKYKITVDNAGNLSSVAV